MLAYTCSACQRSGGLRHRCPSTRRTGWIAPSETIIEPSRKKPAVSLGYLSKPALRHNLPCLRYPRRRHCPQTPIIAPSVPDYTLTRGFLPSERIGNRQLRCIVCELRWRSCMFDAATLRPCWIIGLARRPPHSNLVRLIQRQWRTGIGHVLYGHLDCHQHNAPTCKGRTQ